MQFNIYAPGGFFEKLARWLNRNKSKAVVVAIKPKQIKKVKK